MTDAIDEYIIQHLKSYKEVKLINISNQLESKLIELAENKDSALQLGIEKELKLKAALIKNKLLGNTEKVKRDMYLINKFPGFQKSQIKEKVEILNINIFN